MKRLLTCLVRVTLIAVLSAAGLAQSGGELRFCLHAEPKTLNPLLASTEPDETVRYLTGGVLVRMNRSTQDMEPELASAWKVSNGSKTISFTLREGLRFSDGTPFGVNDVAYTMQQLMDPALHSPTGDAFRSSQGKVETHVQGKNQISITFPAPVAGIDRLFDQVAILSSTSPKKELAVLGPYYVAENKAGAYLLLKRNPYYWKKDSSGHALPYIDSVRIDIESNRDIEMLRLSRGEINFINSMDAEYYDKVVAQDASMAHDAGPSFDTEQIWFNQVASSPLPAYKKAWFTSTNFRRGISESINRADMARIVYRGHAVPAVGAISPANKFWFNSSLQPHPFDPKSALQRFGQDGFKLQDGVLHDRDGHAVEFSIITNAGNKPRERMATMIQQDLGEIGIKVNVVTLDFPSLIERITRTYDYEACLLGLVNLDLDPNGLMTVWLSSGEDHQWNPSQKTPATAWEAQIDELMRAQASSTDPKKRKTYFDKVQGIAWEQEPFIYLINKNALSAVATSVHNAHPVVLRPQVYWNIDQLWLGSEVAKK